METTKVLGLSVEIFAADDFFFGVWFVFLTFIISEGRWEKKQIPSC